MFLVVPRHHHHRGASMTVLRTLLLETCNFGCSAHIATITLAKAQLSNHETAEWMNARSQARGINRRCRLLSRGLSNFSGAIAAWRCLAPVACARDPLSMPITLAAACTPAHYVANLSLFLFWITGGIFLLVGGRSYASDFGRVNRIHRPGRRRSIGVRMSIWFGQ
jgi:hypothetical protein